MMVWRPSEANLRGRKPECDFSEVAKNVLVQNLFDQIKTGFLRVEALKPEAGEARRKPRRDK